MGEGCHAVLTIRIKPGVPVRTALAAMERVFKQFNPASPFIYSFVDKEHNAYTVTKKLKFKYRWKIIAGQ